MDCTGLFGCNCQDKNVWSTAVFCVFYRVKHLWRRALSALPMASPRRHSPPSAAAPPSKEWYLKSKRSVTASWISALLPDLIQMLLVKWHSYQVTSPIGEHVLFCICFNTLKTNWLGLLLQYWTLRMACSLALWRKISVITEFKPCDVQQISENSQSSC